MLSSTAALLGDLELTPAHYITAFFLIGFGRGQRWRQVLTWISVEDAKAVLAAGLGELPDGPIQAGFDLGYRFEPMRADDGE